MYFRKHYSLPMFDGCNSVQRHFVGKTNYFRTAIQCKVLVMLSDFNCFSREIGHKSAPPKLHYDEGGGQRSYGPEMTSYIDRPTSGADYMTIHLHKPKITYSSLNEKFSVRASCGTLECNVCQDILKLIFQRHFISPWRIRRRYRRPER